MQERAGLIRLDVVHAADPWHAPTFTEFIGGPRASVTVRLAAAGLEPGGVAGLALSARRQAWLGVERGDDGFTLTLVDEASGQASRMPLTGPRVWLRAECDFVRHRARFSHGTDGAHYDAIGVACSLGEDRSPFQSIRCLLFAYHAVPGRGGGHAEFDSFLITWP